jgi:soluble lytic murein transglycosylase-like protein
MLPVMSPPVPRQGLLTSTYPGLQFSRRKAMIAALVAHGQLLFSEQSWAGGQLEEPLADAVRSALSAAVADAAPPEPVFADTEARLAYLRWLGAMSERLKKKKPDFHIRKDFLQTAWYESRRAGLETSLVLGLVQVESNFRKFAVSKVGARGYMQVMPFWVRLIGDGDVSKLFQLQTNLRFGCVILRHYLDRERGDLFMALGRYNGSRGKAEYPNAVLGAQKLWAWRDGG